VGCVFFWERKKEEKECVISSYGERCCSWERCVQELNIKIFPWQNPWSFISNSCSSQIHCWICVKLQIVLV
jgi:hypothetical protein